MFSPEEFDFLNHGLRLANFVDRKLGVKMATLVHPRDLALVGTSAYTNGEIIFKNVDSRKHAIAVANSYAPAAFPRLGITRDQFINEYPGLITRNNDYSQGKVAEAIKSARSTLTDVETDSLESEFARLSSMLFKLEPDLFPQSGISMDALDTGLTVYSADRVPLHVASRPEVFMEYGPGVMGYKRLQEELHHVPVSILIEKNSFTNKLLSRGLRLHGYSSNIAAPPAVITRRDGMKSATGEILTAGFGGLVDTVVMSMAQSAGMDEITAGIGNGYRLLKDGGVFIAQHPYDLLEPADASGRDTLASLKRQFGESEPNMQFFQEFQTIQSTTGRPRRLFRAVFVK